MCTDMVLLVERTLLRTARSPTARTFYYSMCVTPPSVLCPLPPGLCADC
jgi:hypothetical protein